MNIVSPRFPRLLSLFAILLCLQNKGAFSFIINLQKINPVVTSSHLTRFSSKDSEKEQTPVHQEEVAVPEEPKTLPPVPTPLRVSSRQQPTANDIMMALGTNPRRIALSLLSGTGIALAGNLFGITSLLLSRIDESAVEQSGLDTYFPRGDYKRVKTPDYTFVVPKEWVADTALELAKAQRRAQPLDFNIRRGGGGTLPDAAFGPPGRLDSRGVSQGDTNVSVIKSTVGQDYSLSVAMKSPNEGASWLLENSIAPPQSGRKATLLNASEDGNGIYQFEYRVERGERGPPLQAISVLGERRGTLLTLTVIAPEREWSDNSKLEPKLRKIASSFHLR